MTLAGPVANLLSVFLVWNVMPKDDSFPAALGALFVAGSAFCGIINLLPLQPNGVMNDGMTLWALLFSRSRRERLVSIVTLVADLKQGKTIKSFEGYSLNKWAAVTDGTNQQVVANWIAYHQTQDPAVEAHHLENCLAASPTTTPAFRDQLIVEAARYQIMRRNRADLARQWLALDESGQVDTDRLEIDALVLQAEDEFPEAIGKVDEALKHLENSPEGPLRTSREQGLRKLRESLLEKLKPENLATDPTISPTSQSALS
jgi:hypothetical protein